MFISKIKVLSKLTMALSLLFISQSLWAMACPATPNCTYTKGNSSTSVSLSAGQNLCLTSGTFNGHINSISSTSTIHVAQGVFFSPASLNDPSGKIINCGLFNLPNNMSANPGFKINNFGTTNFSNTFTYNGDITINNKEDGVFNYTVPFILDNNSTLVNNGSITGNKDFTINSGSSFTNNGYVDTGNGAIIINSNFTNDGFIKTANFFRLNASSVMTNNCSIESEGSFYNDSGNSSNIISTEEGNCTGDGG